MPYYVIPFDKSGICEGPHTREHLLGNATQHTDIFLFSHGWNNDWSAATALYESFIVGVQALHREGALEFPPNFKPLLVGVFWPSQTLTWFESEVGPGFASASPQSLEAAAEAEQRLLRDVAEALPVSHRTRFHELASASSVSAAEAAELAELLASAIPVDDEAGAGTRTADDLLAAAAALATPEPGEDDVGKVGSATGGAGPSAAGWHDVLSKLKVLDPRHVVKPFTVWQMKDRAGVVGHEGVAPLLQALLDAAPDARIHLLGHSYGCKVVMTALCAQPDGTRGVESVLLLQPAVSQYAFAREVPDEIGPGGFHSALLRVKQPICATYSANDVPLTRLYHIALRRSSDPGELQYAGDGSTPSHYAAMGGFGAQASGAEFQVIEDVGVSYNFERRGPLRAINGTRTIDGHGDISHPETWWLSMQLATAHETQLA
ncbi:alpha/beta fold hydrolase [Paucibacter sp. XJ19-41]|uniref:alpha/beta fold hydrolase n=1 Tax=Paucibacter sp. XJ19-41 TaxID=2927824 RepID=UPI00234B9372|nr:alpha/beta hydrolase [Paucibacter sp. XJ19-41]MDC6170700.1 alpha/beta hydrolase [Paucibacter sp. XJ19-41]